MRRMYPLLIAALLALILASCGAESTNSGNHNIPNTTPGLPPTSTEESPANTSKEPTPSIDIQDPSGNQQDELNQVAKKVIESLRERDLKSLAEWIDPEQGLRFSPYSHIDSETDLVFKADTLPTFKDTEKLTWGSADGSGEAIALSFRDYYEKFVYNQDFASATNVSINKILGTGNVTFNATSIYPNSSYVEFYFPSFDKQLNGMDWQSLVLVFLPHEKDWKLVSIVHGQWTT